MRKIRRALFVLALCACCAFPTFWRDRLLLPAANAISQLTGRFPIPFYALLATACLLGMRRPRRVACALTASLLLMWFPAYFVPRAPIAAAGEAEVRALCENLIDALNRSPLEFADSAIPQAIAAVQTDSGCELPEYAVKFGPARLLNVLGLAGIYVPWTAEALINPDLNAAALPFTAVHELTHRLGIADETQANLAAWKISLRAGGELADSARLWALRYAMAREREADSGKWAALIHRMNASTRERFYQMGGGDALSG
ncbi:MAG: DUF3810 family protein, partial [Candidatus Faecivicinus sp.]|nr:DUF3810 family protein [Candidatus Faecivicinus sp.]